MAFPVVQANTTAAGAAATSNVVTLPATISANDMLLAIFTANGGTGATITWNSSAVGAWTQISSNTFTTNYKTEVWSRIADGTEDGKSMRIDFDTTRTFGWIVYRISGVSSNSSNVAVRSATDSGTTPNPPSLTPGWGVIDTLWLAVASHQAASFTTLTGVPPNYSNNVASFGSGTTRVSIISTDRSLNATTEDPGAYTRTSSGTSLNLTIAVRGLGIQVTSANSTIYANSSQRLIGESLSGVTNVLLTSGTRNVQTTVTSADSGNVYFTVPPISTLLSSNIKFQSVTLSANDSGSSASINSLLLPNTGYGIHDVTDTSQVGVPTCIYYGQIPSLVVGDQILYQSSNVSIDSQGFPTFSNNATQFDYYIFDSADETWGTVGTYYATSTSQLVASSRTFSLVNSPDGNRYSKYPTGNNIIAPYSVYPITTGGLFDGASIPNANSKWRIITARNASRWEWYNGGGYTFDATGASAGDYTAIYEVRDWDGQGNNATASVTVSVS